jgi:hypothetical protein
MFICEGDLRFIVPGECGAIVVREVQVMTNNLGAAE